MLRLACSTFGVWKKFGENAEISPISLPVTELGAPHDVEVIAQLTSGFGYLGKIWWS
jgi:hypothetical protein